MPLACSTEPVLPSQGKGPILQNAVACEMLDQLSHSYPQGWLSCVFACEGAGLVLDLKPLGSTLPTTDNCRWGAEPDLWSVAAGKGGQGREPHSHFQYKVLILEEFL